jgi:hypothetical protein
MDIENMLRLAQGTLEQRDCNRGFDGDIKGLLEIICNLAILRDNGVGKSFQELYAQLPDDNQYDQCRVWWKLHGSEWSHDFMEAKSHYADGIEGWELNVYRREKFQEYYDANLLLANCLNSECYVSREVREEIEATMLLPLAEIEKWKIENAELRIEKKR